MIAREGDDLYFEAWYGKDGEAVTGLTVTCDVRGPDGTELVTAASATEIGDGFYTYTLADAEDAGNYRAKFVTAGDVDEPERPSLWTVVSWAGLIDAAISTRAVPGDLAVTVSGTGEGSETVTDYCLDENGDPLEGVEVRVRATSDPMGAILAETVTSSNGSFTVNLDPGTYKVWFQLGRRNFNNPNTLEV
jgi:hypothetical protein